MAWERPKACSLSKVNMAAYDRPVVNTVHKQDTKAARAWQKQALAEAAAQPEDGRGEMIEYWLKLDGRQDFDGEEMDDNGGAYGPLCVSDPRLNNGTLTDEQVVEYVRMTHGEAPLMWQRQPWNDENEDTEEGG